MPFCWFCHEAAHFTSLPRPPNEPDIYCLISTGVKPFRLHVLSTELVLRKVAVDRELRLSTEHYGCRQGQYLRSGAVVLRKGKWKQLNSRQMFIEVLHRVFSYKECHEN